LRRFLTQLAVATAYVAVIAAVLPRAYQITDDAVLTAAERGGDIVPHVGPAWSWLLVQLYDVAPGVPWHGLSLYAAAAVALAIALELVAARTEGAPRLSVAAKAIVMIAFFPAIATPTYTMSAILIAGAGVLVALDGLEARRSVVPAAAIGGGLFAVGYLIRVESPPAPLVALAPWIVRGAIAYGRRRPRALQVAAVVAVLAGPYAGARLTGPLVVDAQPPEVRAYFAYNDVRFRIHLQGRFLGLHHREPALLERAGWTPRDYELFEHWIYLDEDRYPREKLARLLDTGGELPGFSVGGLAKDLSKAFLLRPGPYLLLAVALVALWLARRGVLGPARPRTAQHAAALAYLVIAFVAVLIVSRMPARIADSVTALAVVAFVRGVLGEVDRGSPACTRATWRIAGAIAALPVAAAAALAVRLPTLDTTNEVSGAVAAEVARLGDPLLVVYAQAGLDADPLTASPRPYHHIGLGWEIFSPAWYRELAHHGLRRASEVPGALVDNPRGYVLVVPRYAERVRADLGTWVGAELELVEVWRSPEAGRATAVLYQVKRKRAP
jgi:hypothetical protein